MSRPRRVVMATSATAAEAVDALARVARSRRDTGVEVIWLGGGVEVAALVAVAVAEDADEVAIGPGDDVEAVRAALHAAAVPEVDVATAGGAD